MTVVELYPYAQEYVQNPYGGPPMKRVSLYTDPVEQDTTYMKQVLLLDNKTWIDMGPVLIRKGGHIQDTYEPFGPIVRYILP